MTNERHRNSSLKPPAGSEPAGPRIELPVVHAAEAFLKDPVYTWMLPRSLQLKPRLRTLFLAEMEQYVMRNGGTVWTTTHYDGAVAVLPPGASEFPNSVTAKEALKWVRAFGTRMALAARVQRLMEERHPREPHFYVRVVGVRPALQGRGLGSALMQPTLERADLAGLPTYIEASTERSAALYERLGFVHLGVHELPGGPPAWPMRRSSAGSTQTSPSRR